MTRQELDVLNKIDPNVKRHIYDEYNEGEFIYSLASKYNVSEYEVCLIVGKYY